MSSAVINPALKNLCGISGGWMSEIALRVIRQGSQLFHKAVFFSSKDVLRWPSGPVHLAGFDRRAGQPMSECVQPTPPSLPASVLFDRARTATDPRFNRLLIHFQNWAIWGRVHVEI
jgi:hypothetical protein